MADRFCGPCGGMRNEGSPCPLDIPPPGCPLVTGPALAPESVSLFRKLWDGLAGVRTTTPEGGA